MAASHAGFVEPSVHREDVLKSTSEAGRIHVVVDTRSAQVDGASQNVDDGVV